jgi:hypothetical protein
MAVVLLCYLQPVEILPRAVGSDIRIGLFHPIIKFHAGYFLLMVKRWVLRPMLHKRGQGAKRKKNDSVS